MALLETINADLKKAMLEKDDVTRDTLRMLKTELLTLENPDELAVLSRAVKSRKDSIESYREGGREDLAAKEQAEIEVIERYLPKQLSEDEARATYGLVISSDGSIDADATRELRANLGRQTDTCSGGE